MLIAYLWHSESSLSALFMIPYISSSQNLRYVLYENLGRTKVWVSLLLSLICLILYWWFLIILVCLLQPPVKYPRYNYVAVITTCTWILVLLVLWFLVRVSFLGNFSFLEHKTSLAKFSRQFYIAYEIPVFCCGGKIIYISIPVART